MTSFSASATPEHSKLEPVGGGGRQKEAEQATYAAASNYLYGEEHIWEANEVGELQILSHHSTSRLHMTIDVLMPNGILIPMQCPSSRNLAQLKLDAFIQARKLPLAAKLGEMSNYVFMTIGIDGVHVELYDEQRPISSVQSAYLPFLALVEPEGNREEKELAQNIARAMGISLLELERNLDREAEIFRTNLFEICQVAERERGVEGTKHYAFVEEAISGNSWDCQPITSGSMNHEARQAQGGGGGEQKDAEIHERDLDYVQYPEDTHELGRRAVEKLKRKIQFSGAYLEIWFRAKEEGEYTHSVAIREVLEQTTSNIIGTALHLLNTQHGLEISTAPSEYILQICGKRVFITREVPITQFEYIRSCFENYRIPRLVLRNKVHVLEKYKPPPKIFEPAYMRREKHSRHMLNTNAEQKKHVTLWELDENLRLRILSATQMTTIDEGHLLYVRIMVSAGRHLLEHRSTTPVQPTNPRWEDGTIEFGTYLKDLAECTKLTFLLMSRKEKKGRVEEAAIGWAVLQLFDWEGRLRTGRQSVHLLSPPSNDSRFASCESLLSALPSYGSSTGCCERVGRIEVGLPEHDSLVKYPDPTTITRFVDILARREARNEARLMLPRLTVDSPELARIIKLRKCLDSSRLSEEEQTFLWRLRHKLRELFPQMIVVLADCPLIWKEREYVCELYGMLKKWPALRVDTAIELLDERFSDPVLRSIAVEHLDRSLNDDQFQLYLPLITQAIRYEPHASSPLAKMLVKRALMNYRLGHTLFWLLRAELASQVPVLNNGSSSSSAASSYLSPLYIRFALMLEAVCRGMSPTHLESLNRQVEVISILTALSGTIRAIGNKESANKELKQALLLKKEQMQHIDSPLNQTDRLGELLVDECRVMGSAKMPLKLTWSNPEDCLPSTSKSTHQLIFKNGDDMRQDLLTLQVMRIMDAKWKSQNLDYCMTIYEVLPMGRNIGIINVVQNCQTLFQIQCEARRGASFGMDVSLLNRYIYQKCSTDSKKYMECADRFTSSTAGYCVATYVLGIKDRHQDNIMLANDGRIFHIDFGHFLGHTKRKLGINRERTDFVLTDHFLYVISRGKQNFRQTYEYTSFRQDCVKGFMVLYHHARFFIVLFRMMMGMGLPELSSEESLEFLRTSLMYDQPERGAARDAYLQLFEDVVKSDWSVSINWWFHSLANMKHT